ncbi:MAG: zinc ion binding [Geoglossum simile]|nr:MAG: zinc ion binding [Geoglossum simile]
MALCPTIVRATPAIPELDFAGTLIALGSDVEGFVVGNKVFGAVLVGPHIKMGVGTLAEYVVVEAATVARVPVGLGEREAAGLPVAACTALVLVEAAGLKEGDRVAVNGASGGVGTFVVQMVREKVGKSGRIVGICSARNADLVKELGADEVIDYTAHVPVHQYLATHYSNSPFTAFIDSFGVADLYAHCAPCLAPGKPFVTVGVANAQNTYPSILYALYAMMWNSLWPTVLGGGSRKYVSVRAFVESGTLTRVRDLVEEGKLKVVVDGAWEMERALEAYERMLSHRACGKIIIKIQDF